MMLGGVIGGYCANGRLKSATAPARVMTIDSTAAKIGRSMKKWESITAPQRATAILQSFNPTSPERQRRAEAPVAGAPGLLDELSTLSSSPAPRFLFQTRHLFEGGSSRGGGGWVCDLGCLIFLQNLRQRRGRRLRRFFHFRLHHSARSNALHAADNHALAVLDPLFDDTQSLKRLAKLHRAVLDFVHLFALVVFLLLDDIDVFPPLIAH